MLSTDAADDAPRPPAAEGGRGTSLATGRWLLALFLTALLVRMVVAVRLGEAAVFPDSLAYRNIARNLLAGRGFGESADRRASRAPGYPLLLALVPGGASGSLVPVRLVQSLIGASTCLLVWLLARHLFGTPTAFAAMSMAAIYPFHIYLAGAILAEVLFMFLLTAAMLILARVIVPAGVLREATGAQRRAAAQSLAAGALLGAATLTRASLFLFPFFLLPLWLWARRPRRPVLRQWFLLMLGFGLVMAPWVWRNWRIYGRFVPTTLQAGESLYEANNPDATGGPMLDEVERALPEVMQLSEYERDREFRLRALRYMAANPGRTLHLALIKLSRFWNIVPNHAPFRTPFVVAVSVISYVPVLVLALLGVIGLVCRRGWDVLLVLLAPIVYYSFLHSIFVGSLRYRMPVELFLFVLAGFGLCEWWQCASRRLRMTMGGRCAGARLQV